MARNKQKKIVPPRPHAGMDIAPEAVAPFGRSTDHERPSFRFGHADPHRYRLRDWTGPEIDQLLQTLVKMERLTWREIKTTGGQGKSSGGLGCKPIERRSLPTLPEGVPPDVQIHEVRVSERMHLFGYRVDAIFHVVWFDREHAVLKG